ncbi:MAG: hypothetical protein CSA62_01065 [Planctomycetota bacterium]|nr:MAG: hypothetical protein CSA62_01065 [Planctomycetota bacterium]
METAKALSEDESRSYSSGQLAAAAGVNVQTLRYYEKRGILPRPLQTGSGHRRYGSDAVQLVRFVKRAQALGFSLAEIQELLDLRSGPDPSCSQVQERVCRKLSEIEARMQDLRSMQQTLKELAHQCTGEEGMRDCVILRAFDRGNG